MICDTPSAAQSNTSNDRSHEIDDLHHPLFGLLNRHTTPTAHGHCGQKPQGRDTADDMTNLTTLSIVHSMTFEVDEV